MVNETVEINFDGGTYISNPGAAAGAAVLYLPAEIELSTGRSTFLDSTIEPFAIASSHSLQSGKVFPSLV